ncbi:MAG: hypothetical protein ACHP6H_00405 [Legionellales bacterium]
MRGQNIKFIWQGAQSLRLPARYIPEINSVAITLGSKNYFFFQSINPLNEGASIFIAKNKDLLNRLLASKGYPVPKAVAIDHKDLLSTPLELLIKELRFPLVAKPMADTGRGLDVFCNIKEMHTLTKHVNKLLHEYGSVQIEEFQQYLKEYRVLVLKNQVIGVVERFAAHVLGDGVHSIKALIKDINKHRSHGAREETQAAMLADEECKQCLQEQNYSLNSIPPLGTRIRLSFTVNIGRGGSVMSHGKKIHPHNTQYLCQAAKILGLDCVGFDVLCEDINSSFRHTQWIIIEANFNPDLSIHENPQQGKRASVVNKILLQLIYRHPIGYVAHLCRQGLRSVYARTGLLLGCLYAILHYLT